VYCVLENEVSTRVDTLVEVAPPTCTGGRRRLSGWDWNEHERREPVSERRETVFSDSLLHKDLR